MFFGTSKLKIIFEDGNYGYVGQCSSGLVARLRVILGKAVNTPVIEIGNHCESAVCDILIGGEHPNEKLFNNSLSGIPALRHLCRDKGIDAYTASHRKTTVIKNGVILSRGCVILPGALIEDGAVIGSGAVVTKSKIPKYSVAAGNPAKEIRPRFDKNKGEILDSLKWWDWDLEYFIPNLPLLFDAENHYRELQSNAVYQDFRHRLVLKYFKNNQQIVLIGIETDEVFKPLEKLPRSFQEYFLQIPASEESIFIWMANPFRLLS